MSRVWVVGSVNADLVVRTARLPSPGETVTATGVERGLGGKGANQAVGAARLGADVAFVGAVGDDADGAALASVLRAEGIDVERLAVVDGPTGMAVVLVDASGENSIVVVPGANGQVAPEDAAPAAAPGDVVVCQGELPADVTIAALVAARAAGATTVWNPAPATPDQRSHLGLADVLVVNEIELAVLADRSEIDGGVAALAAAAGGDVVATLGADGVVAVVAGERLVLPARAVPVVDTTGAGDCFVGVLAAALVEGEPLADAIGTAVVASSIAVQRPGAAGSMPTRAEVASASSGT